MKPILQHYLKEYDRFKKNLLKTQPALFLEKRQAAFEVFLKQGFPTYREENWAGIASAPFLKQAFHVGMPLKKHQLSSLALPKPLASSMLRFVFVNGYFSKTLSSDLSNLPKGLHVETFAQYTQHVPDHLDLSQNAQEIAPLDAFDAMNQAFNQDGIMLHIDDHQVIEPLIEFCFVNETTSKTSKPRLIATRHQIKIGENSQARFLESYHSIHNVNFTPNIPSLLINVVIELKLAKKAQVIWAQKIEAEQAYNHVAALHVLQEAQSHLAVESLIEEGGLVRQTIPIFLRGEKAFAQLKNLSIAKAQHNIDHHVIVRHEASHTSSVVDYRGIADDQARIGFRGEVYAKAGLGQINATQNSRHLLLSDQAVIDTQPRLELFTDDLVCTHGATVGSLDETALFYLQTRGISQVKARALLIEAFSQALLNKMDILSVAGSVSHHVEA